MLHAMKNKQRETDNVRKRHERDELQAIIHLKNKNENCEGKKTLGLLF